MKTRAPAVMLLIPLLFACAGSGELNALGAEDADVGALVDALDVEPLDAALGAVDLALPLDVGPVDAAEAPDVHAPEADVGAPDAGTLDLDASAPTLDAADPVQPSDLGPVDAVLDAGPIVDARPIPDVLNEDAFEPPAAPDPIAPCDEGATCWRPEAPLSRCRAAAIPEDFSSGNYNAHRWSGRIYGDATTTLRLTVTGGAFAPAILLARADGLTLYDGQTGLTRDGLTVTPRDDGRAGGPAQLEVWSEADLDVFIYVTGWAVIDSGYRAFLDTDSVYRLDVSSTCDDPYLPCNVNGHVVNDRACGWLNYVGREVVPRMRGARADRLRDASIVAWWSLKEGVMYLENPIAYSNCNFPDGDRHIGPVDACPSGRAWQVGLAATQVPWSPSLADLEALAVDLFPGMSVDEVLAWAAAEGRQGAANAATIVGSTGDLRRSWLLRASPIGYTVEAPVITNECVDDTRAWCFGSGWDSTRLYAPDRAGAERSMSDIRALLDAIAP